MAEFSREYLQAKGIDCQGDFSILAEFRKLKEGCYIPEICEGFGSMGIARIENKCQLMFPGENDQVVFVDFQEFKKSFEN
jgi:hypothetical protein